MPVVSQMGRIVLPLYRRTLGSSEGSCGLKIHLKRARTCIREVGRRATVPEFTPSLGFVSQLASPTSFLGAASECRVAHGRVT